MIHTASIDVDSTYTKALILADGVEIVAPTSANAGSSPMVSTGWGRPCRFTARRPYTCWHRRSRWQQIRSLILGCCTLALILGLAPPPDSAGRTASEEQLKASFVYRFTHFVDWPEGAFADDGSPLVACLVGQKHFAGALEDVTRDCTAKSRSVRVIRLAIDPSGRTKLVGGPNSETPDFDLTNCHVLFFAQSDAGAFEGIAARLWAQPVLTIGEDPTFASVGGMIKLVERDRRLAFEINRRALEAAGLRYSSQLLRLATVIHNGGGK